PSVMPAFGDHDARHAPAVSRITTRPPVWVGAKLFPMTSLRVFLLGEGRTGSGRVSLLDVLAAGGLLLFTTFVIVPTLMSFSLGFTNQNPLYQASDFVGLDNYVEQLGDAALHRALKNTVLLTVAVTIGANLGGLILALLLNGTSRYFRSLRTVVFIPQILSAVIVSFIFTTILTNRGILNSTLDGVGLSELTRPWLGLPDLALGSIGFVVMWQMMGFTTVVYLAALQSVPNDLIEAAEIDGAGAWKRFRNVTFPLLGPGVTISTAIVLITTLRLYDHIAVLTGGGPGFRTESAVFYLLRMGFTNNRIGYASSIALVLLVIIGVSSGLIVAYLRRREVRL
ncbi:MAG: sugar ABC transporter permease, partial [Chloroflexota bacterium]|nr:sugar ABC transporter permease [Chloroflexota bacterium]